MSQPEKFDYYLVTGTSRGIGEAVAKSLMTEGNFVFCVSRNQNPSIGVEAFVKHRQLKDIAHDLNHVHQIRDLVRSIFREIAEDSIRSITLINNAGTIQPIRQIGSSEASERIIRNVNVNLTAAMLITDAFVREVQDMDCPKQVVNLTSGAATRAVDGWSAYCTAKAGLEMFTECLALEQQKHKYPVKVVAFAPGVVDTEMQEEIRSAPDEHSDAKSRFLDLHKEEKLFSTEFVAGKILELLEHEQFGAKTRMDIREDF